MAMHLKQTMTFGIRFNFIWFEIFTPLLQTVAYRHYRPDAVSQYTQ
jgi:hypothetical protein